MRHLSLGAWRRIVVETDEARVGLAPAAGDVALVATAASAPLGQLGRLLARAVESRPGGRPAGGEPAGGASS
jgi:hypothetical protein